MDKSHCPFCTLPSHRIVSANIHGAVILDGYPVSDGHSLIVAKRHVGSFFELSTEEKLALYYLLDEQRARLINELSPSCFNIGINDGCDAGQTIPHVHIHLIPRYTGDMADPRGGVRWIIPDKAKYW